MYVIYHSSDTFAKVTGVSMLSLFENNKSRKEIEVLYIQKGMTEKNREKLMAIAEQYGRKLTFLDMPDWAGIKNLTLKSCKSGWLGFGYNRLFLTDIVPEHIDRVLYLDSDTVIEDSLDDFWNIDFEDCYMAGVDDCLSSKYRKLVGLSEDGVYCNSGVLLINLKKWREDNIEEQFISLMREHNGYFVFNEQSILNSVFEGKIKIMPQQYNVNSLIYLYNYDELMRLRRPYNFSYTAEECEWAREHPVITHFTGNFYVLRRPWIESSDHPHKDAFLKYYRMTPWSEEPLDSADSVKPDRKASFCKKLPRRIMISSVSFIYNVLRPKHFKKEIKKHRSEG